MLVIFLGLIVVMGAILLIRNQCVYTFRGKLLAGISSAAQEDIRRGDYTWRRRYDAFDAVSYHRMIWQFWKPWRAFYPRHILCYAAGR